jgi:hypothetical protein
MGRERSVRTRAGSVLGRPRPIVPSGGVPEEDRVAISTRNDEKRGVSKRTCSMRVKEVRELRRASAGATLVLVGRMH